MTLSRSSTSLLLVLLLGAVHCAAAADAKGGQGAVAWGESVESAQLGLSVTDRPVQASGRLLLQLRIRNQGKQPLTYINEALSHPEIEVDGVWYTQSMDDACCSAPKQIAAGAGSEPVSFQLARVYTVTSGTDAAETAYMELSPGKHSIRARIPSRDLALVQSAGSHSLVLTSNLIRVEVPPRTGAEPFSPYPNPVALSCKATPGRRADEFHGSLKRGETFSQTSGAGWILKLTPQEPRAYEYGWFLQVSAVGRDSEDLARLTLPLRFGRPTYIFGSDFRNADNTGPNDGSVNAAGELRKFTFSPAIGREIQHYDSTSLTEDDLRQISSFGHGWLYVDSYQLTPPEKGGTAAFESMTFRACLTWPADAPSASR